MEVVKTRGVLESIIDSKLTSVTKKGDWDRGIPEIETTEIYRLAHLVAYQGRFDYERWIEERDPNVSFLEGERSNEMRFRIVKKPRLREIPNIMRHRGWEEAQLQGGILVSIHDIPVLGIPEEKQKTRTTYSLYLPTDEEGVFISNHLTRGLRAKVTRLNPLGKGEIASIDDIYSVAEMVARASVYYQEDLIFREVIVLPNPST